MTLCGFENQTKAKKCCRPYQAGLGEKTADEQGVNFGLSGKCIQYIKLIFRPG